MSTLSAKRPGQSGRRSSRKSTVPRPQSFYDIYCINFYDNGLNAVRDEFIKQIKLGLRRFMFVIDLDNELKEAIAANTKSRRLSNKSKVIDIMPEDPVQLTLMRIQDCLTEYEVVTQKINSEISFNLLNYYQSYLPAQLKIGKGKVDTKNNKADGTKSKRAPKSKSDGAEMEKISCFSVNVKEHHKVGKGKPLSKRLYIKDEPSNTSILIIIIGKLNNEFYRALLRNNQPLRGIVHFMPEDCAYDLLVPRPRREKFLLETVEKIQKDIHSLRKRTISKPVGIFQQRLPQMSMCQSLKYASNIFDQLSWFVYDMQTLRQQYEEFYVRPYNEINVKMSPQASIKASYQAVKLLNTKGHYLAENMPAVVNDDATIYLYVDSLLTTFGQPRELLTEIEVLLLANPSSMVQTKVLDKIKVYVNAFKSIVKLIKNESLFLEETNTLLCNLVAYMDQKLLRNIYHACLEYNILRRYFHSGYITESLYYTPYAGEVEPQHLRKYAKLYLTNDSVDQRIVQLINEYNNYNVKEIYPNVNLYTFKRGLNEVFEYQKEVVIPTRLCFRDFTLYEMQPFLKDLVTQQMFEDAIEEPLDPLSNYPSVYTLHDASEDYSNDDPNSSKCRNNKNYFIAPSIFIRPKSLKAKKVLEQQTDTEMKEQVSPRITKQLGSTSNRGTIKSARVTSNFPADNAGGDNANKPLHIGLGPDHPMLTGYSLDNARQTIKTKTSKYHFEEGQLTLYEEKWNFRTLNKCMSIEIDKQLLHFTNEPGNMNATSHNMRLQTPNGVSLRVEPREEECAKAVLSYPNGLTTYCLDTHTEHLWSPDQQHEINESRRICTPYGCVIVHYQGNDTVLIMRYNGEVYRLYSYLHGEVEEEGEIEDDSEFINACSTQSTYSSYKPLRPQNISLKGSLSQSLHKSRRQSAGTDKKSKARKSRATISSEKLSAQPSHGDTRPKRSSRTAALFASVDAELKYLDFIMQLFNLNYKHLELTTSLGSVVHLEKEKIKCGKPIRVTEWHDYFANESYAMRDDGVRMVWTKDCLRCYHSNGTMISTTTIDGWDRGITEDEMDNQISSSSSHRQHEDITSTFSTVRFINVPQGIAEEITLKPITSTKSLMEGDEEAMLEIEMEDLFVYDYSFITYAPDSYLMQHKLYPGTLFSFTQIGEGELNLDIKIKAADNLQLRLYSLPTDEMDPKDVAAEELFNHSNHDSKSSEADSDQWTHRKKVQGSNFSYTSPSIKKNTTHVLDISVSNLNVSVKEESIELNAQLSKYGCDGNINVVRDNLQLKMDYNQSLTNAFQKWVNEFYKFINCFCPKWRTTYFVQASSANCVKKGLELCKSVPSLGKFNFCAGNYFIDPVELQSINALMESHLDWYKQDMLKFPRFSTEKRPVSMINLPNVLSTRIYVEIPAQLAYTDRIHLFLCPFEKIKFRKLKHRFNEAVSFHLHPNLRNLLQMQISLRNWQHRHAENKRRMFLDQQRLSLYAAMLKHKVYPNYFQFKDQYNYHVRNIDFFEFVASKCNAKVHPEPYMESEQDEVEKPAPTKEQKSRRKKCLCPKYEKSL